MTKAPTPILPRGAGGPLWRAAGRVSLSAECQRSDGAPGPASPAAVILEPDPLIRLLVTTAVRGLGFVLGPAPTDPVVVAFVSLERPDGCRRVRAASPSAGGSGSAAPTVAPFVVGYGTGSLASLAVHRAHACVDLVLALRAADDRAAFTHLPADDLVRCAGLTAREADVLVLLLAGLTTTAIAVRLCVSAATARSHCRAVLRKLGASDRQALRSRFLTGPPPAACGASWSGASRFA